jgi:hypothetical protein
MRSCGHFTSAYWRSKKIGFQHFLAKTANELGTELESLKLIFDMKQELFFKSTLKGALAEEEVADFLNSFFEARNLGDRAELTGNSTGKLHRNKTGDILCYVGGCDGLRIAIECKFDKSIRMGAIAKKDLHVRRTDTVWSQLIEAQANRDGRVGIIVLDYSLIDGAVLKEVENVAFIPSIGFVAIIDSQKGDFSNLTIAYMLARNVAINAKTPEVDFDLLAIIVQRIIKETNEIRQIRELIISNIDINRKILERIEKGLISMEFAQEILKKFLENGTLTKEELLDFYRANDVTDRFKAIETELKKL